VKAVKLIIDAQQKVICAKNQRTFLEKRIVLRELSLAKAEDLYLVRHEQAQIQVYCDRYALLDNVGLEDVKDNTI
jgi:hypothetical protein